MRALLLTRLKRPIMPNILWVDDEIDMLKGHLLFLDMSLMAVKRIS